MSDSVTLWTIACQAPLSMGILQARTLEWVAMPSSRDLPNSGIEPRSPALQEDLILSEPSGKPKNTGVGRLSLFQEIFPTQESNRDLLHCRRILYQLSSQGSPCIIHIIDSQWEFTVWHSETNSGILGPLGTTLGLVHWQRASSPVEAGTAGYL